MVFLLLTNLEELLTFSRRNSRKKNKSDNKMAAMEASVHPVRNRLLPFLPLPNERKLLRKCFKKADVAYKF